MTSIDVKPTPPPNPAAKTKKSVEPKPEPSPEVNAEAQVPGQDLNPRGVFGGQTIPLLPRIGRGPRVRGADVHDVNVCDKAIEWYIIIEPLENSRFAEHCVCRECHWGTYGYVAGEDGVKELKKHVQNQHLFSA